MIRKSFTTFYLCHTFDVMFHNETNDTKAKRKLSLQNQVRTMIFSFFSNKTMASMRKKSKFLFWTSFLVDDECREKVFPVRETKTVKDAWKCLKQHPRQKRFPYIFDFFSINSDRTSLDRFCSRIQVVSMLKRQNHCQAEFHVRLLFPKILRYSLRQLELS